jgi:hypothetical protein
MGPSLLIATCLIAAVRTAKWLPRSDTQLCDQDLNQEIQFAAYAAHRVMMLLMTKFETIFPQRKEPWYQANDEDVPR